MSKTYLAAAAAAIIIACAPVHACPDSFTCDQERAARRLERDEEHAYQRQRDADQRNHEAQQDLYRYNRDAQEDARRSNRDSAADLRRQDRENCRRANIPGAWNRGLPLIQFLDRGVGLATLH